LVVSFITRAPVGPCPPVLGLPKVDIKYARTATSDLIPRDVCLLREEYVPLLHLGHDVGVPLDFLVVNAFASDHLAHLDVVRWRALEADDSISWIHVALKPVRYHSTLHT